MQNALPLSNRFENQALARRKIVADDEPLVPVENAEGGVRGLMFVVGRGLLIEGRR
jgi:hypothetical protein